MARNISSWLPNLLGPIWWWLNGAPQNVPQRSTVNIIGNVTVTDNPDQDRTDIDLSTVGLPKIEDASGDSTEFPTRSILQFTGGATVTDDSANDRTVIDMSAVGRPTIEDATGNPATFPTRSILQFTGGATVTDDAVNSRTVIAVTSPDTMTWSRLFIMGGG